MRPRKVSDQEVFKVVRKCLIEHGGAVSTQVIADCLGVSQAMLFKRFGSKCNLFQTALLLPSAPEKTRQVLEILENDPTEEPVEVQLKSLCLILLQIFDDLIPCFAALHASGLSFNGPLPDDAPPIRARKMLTGWIAKLQESGKLRQEIHPETIALTLLGAIQHRPVRKHIIHDTNLHQTDEEYVNSIVEVLWLGLSVKPEIPKTET